MKQSRAKHKWITLSDEERDCEGGEGNWAKESGEEIESGEDSVLCRHPPLKKWP